MTRRSGRPSSSTTATCPSPKRWPPAAIASAAKPGAAGRRHQSGNLLYAVGLPTTSSDDGVGIERGMLDVLRKREPGESPGLSRSGMQERPPSTALVFGGSETGKRRPVGAPPGARL